MKKGKVLRAGVALTFAVAMFAPTAQGADIVSNPINLVAPKEIADVPALPFTGLKAAKFDIPTNMVNLTVTPQTGYIGDEMVISGTTLPGNTPLLLTWSTNDGTWVTDVQPNTVNYMGWYKSPTYHVEIATITTQTNGTFTYKTKIPKDWGGVHDIYAVVNGVAVGHGGVQVARSFTMTPTSGPIGTPITIEYSGLSPSLYGGGSAVLYDNKFAGEMQARWTRGVAKATITASGPVGKHYIQANEAISFSYLNIIQSPLPYANSGVGVFTVTKDPGVQKPVVVYPPKMTPTVSARTTLIDNLVDPASKATMTLTTDEGTVGSKTTVKVAGLTTKGVHNIVWATVVGNRVNCPQGQSCWATNSIPLGTVDVTDGTATKEVTVPDHLGGWHVIQIKSGDMVQAQTMFYVKQSILPITDSKGKVVSMGLAGFNPATTPEVIAVGQAGKPGNTFKAGEDFTISVKGVGWTQMDNTLAVTYDNAYIGYACGFNSNGYVVVKVKAMGEPGTHVINLRPLLYTQQPSFANTPYGMVPVLSWDRDFAGLALGYRIPMYTFTIKVVK